MAVSKAGQREDIAKVDRPVLLFPVQMNQEDGQMDGGVFSSEEKSSERRPQRCRLLTSNPTTREIDSTSASTSLG